MKSSYELPQVHMTGLLPISNYFKIVRGKKGAKFKGLAGTEAYYDICLFWRRQWHPTPPFLPGESQGRRSLVGCHLWGHTKLDMTEAT